MLRRVMMADAGGGGGNGFPDYLGATTTGTGLEVTTHSISLPTTVDAGDLLMLHVASAGNNSITYTTPAGWTRFLDVTLVAPRIAMYWKIADGSEAGGTVSTTTNSAIRIVGLVHRIKAGTFSTPPAVSAQIRKSGSGALTAPTLSPPWGSAKTLWLAVMSGVDYNPAALTYPLPDDRVRVTSGPAGGTLSCEAASCTAQVEAASLSPGDYVRAGGSGVMIIHTLAVQPA